MDNTTCASFCDKKFDTLIILTSVLFAFSLVIGGLAVHSAHLLVTFVRQFLRRDVHELRDLVHRLARRVSPGLHGLRRTQRLHNFREELDVPSVEVSGASPPPSREYSPVPTPVFSVDSVGAEPRVTWQESHV